MSPSRSSKRWPISYAAFFFVYMEAARPGENVNKQRKAWEQGDVSRPASPPAASSQHWHRNSSPSTLSVLRTRFSSSYIFFCCNNAFNFFFYFNRSLIPAASALVVCGFDSFFMYRARLSVSLFSFFLAPQHLCEGSRPEKRRRKMYRWPIFSGECRIVGDRGWSLYFLFPPAFMYNSSLLLSAFCSHYF